jgi:PhzF family phenazine biosynthesis protein
VSLPLYQVDAFTDRPFAGNPAGVVLLDGPGDEAWMQSVAAENNLPETAFVAPPGDDGSRDLRWFTPTVEVDLCGHATLATAHVLTTEAGVTDDELAFATRSGVLRARRRDGGIELDLPASVPVTIEDEGRADAARAAAHATIDAEVVSGGGFVLVVLESADAVRALRPDRDAVLAATGFGLIVTSSSATDGDGEGPDIVSRMFAPGAGIDEDPVTGAAHCLLGPFWAGRLGRDTLTAHQASARGGDLTVEVRGDRVALVGRAVTVFRAELLA